jgi:hypothetical protein
VPTSGRVLCQCGGAAGDGQDDLDCQSQATLERRGLVDTAPDLKDRRARLLWLTPAGRAVLAEAVPIWRHLHAAIETALSDPNHLRSNCALLRSWRIDFVVFVADQ